MYNTLPAASGTSSNYGILSTLSQSSTSGTPRLYSIFGQVTDADSYLSYGVYGRADNASNFNYGVYGRAGTTNGYAGYFSGNVFTTGAYQTSDAKFKTGIQTYNNGLDKIMALRPATFEYDTNTYEFMNLPEGEQCGLLAHEVKSVLPHLVKSSFQPYDEPTSEGVEFEAVNYTGIIPELISAIQEQQGQIEELKKRIAELELR